MAPSSSGSSAGRRLIVTVHAVRDQRTRLAHYRDGRLIVWSWYLNGAGMTRTSVPAVNWAGNVTFRAARVHHPASVAQLGQIVAGARRVRALGTGHSFSRVADTTGDLVCLDRLPGTVDIDPAGRTVTLAAGISYAELAGPAPGRVRAGQPGLAAAHLGGRVGGYRDPRLRGQPALPVGSGPRPAAHGTRRRSGRIGPRRSRVRRRGGGAGRARRGDPADPGHRARVRGEPARLPGRGPR